MFSDLNPLLDEMLDEYVQMYVVPYEKVSIKIRFIFDRLFIVLR